MGWKFPEIPRPHPVVHLHYLEHFGASVYVLYSECFLYCIYILLITYYLPTTTSNIKDFEFAICDMNNNQMEKHNRYLLCSYIFEG